MQMFFEEIFVKTTLHAAPCTFSDRKCVSAKDDLTISLPVMRICINFSIVYNDTLVAKGLI